jgi:hypothetical protein
MVIANSDKSVKIRAWFSKDSLKNISGTISLENKTVFLAPKCTSRLISLMVCAQYESKNIRIRQYSTKINAKTLIKGTKRV